MVLYNGEKGKSPVLIYSYHTQRHTHTHKKSGFFFPVAPRKLTGVSHGYTAES